MSYMRKETQVAVRIVEDSGAEVLRFFRKSLAHNFKEDHSLLTEGDRSAHAMITEGLTKAFPDHSIVSEEGQTRVAGNELWVLDPIDGTSNFATGVPHFAVSLAFVRNGIPEIGIVYAPAKGHVFVAERGSGSFFNGARIHVSNTGHLSAARTLLDPGRKTESRKIHGRIIAALRAQGVEQEGRWCAALDLCAVASGERDAFVHRGLNAWDIAAGVLLVEEAGGLVTDLQGNSKDIFQPGIIATNGNIHAEVTRIVREALRYDESD